MNFLKSGYFYILLTIIFTVMAQLLVKSGISKVTASFSEPPRLAPLVLAAFLNPAVLSGLTCALMAAVAWFPAVSRLPISVAYPFLALPMALVLLLAPVFFGERVSISQWLGLGVISIGLWLVAR